MGIDPRRERSHAVLRRTLIALGLVIFALGLVLMVVARLYNGLEPRTTVVSAYGNVMESAAARSASAAAEITREQTRSRRVTRVFEARMHALGMGVVLIALGVVLPAADVKRPWTRTWVVCAAMGGVLYPLGLLFGACSWHFASHATSALGAGLFLAAIAIVVVALTRPSLLWTGRRN